MNTEENINNLLLKHDVILIIKNKYKSNINLYITYIINYLIDESLNNGLYANDWYIATINKYRNILEFCEKYNIKNIDNLILFMRTIDKLDKE